MEVEQHEMEVRLLNVRPENKLNEEPETLIIASIQIIKRSKKNVGKMKFSRWLIFHLKNKFQRRFSKILYAS